MPKTAPIIAALLLGLSYTGTQAFAQTDTGAGTPPSQATTASVKPQTSAAGISYVVGGIGNTSQRQMHDKYGHYSLHVITERKQAYISDAHVTIANSQGETLLSTTMDGPLLYADLSPGNYTVSATLNGSLNNRKVSINQGQSQKVTFQWPHADR